MYNPCNQSVHVCWTLSGLLCFLNRIFFANICEVNLWANYTKYFYNYQFTELPAYFSVKVGIKSASLNFEQVKSYAYTRCSKTKHMKERIKHRFGGSLRKNGEVQWRSKGFHRLVVSSPRRIKLSWEENEKKIMKIGSSGVTRLTTCLQEEFSQKVNVLYLNVYKQRCKSNFDCVCPQNVLKCLVLSGRFYVER